MFFFCFFFNVTATTEIYTLSLHDALPILKYLNNKFHFLFFYKIGMNVSLEMADVNTNA